MSWLYTQFVQVIIQLNSPRCTSRHKANLEAQKGKKVGQSSEKEKDKARNETGEEEGEKKESLEHDISMDPEYEQWAASPLEKKV